MSDFEENMKTIKNISFYIHNVIKETKKVMEFQPKVEQLFNEVNTFSKSHQTLEKENNYLKTYIKAILKTIKQFFRKLLIIRQKTLLQAK